MSEVTADVCVLGGGMSSFHVQEVLSAVAKKDPSLKVVVLTGNHFSEWPLAAGIFLHDMTQYHKWSYDTLAGLPNITYMRGCVATRVDCTTKTVHCEKNSTRIVYKALVVATGQRLPLVYPNPGASLEERTAELLRAQQALKSARSVVYNGAGLVGLELIGDLRAKLNSTAKVFLLSRDGSVAKGSFAPNSKEVALIKKRLEELNVQIVTGEVAGEVAVGLDPIFEAGTKLQVNGPDGLTTLECDAYVPAFSQKCQTSFFTDQSPAFLQENSRRIVVADTLQSTVYPEVFGVGVTTRLIAGHPISSRLTAQAKTAGLNALNFLKGQPLVKHVDRESPSIMEAPMNVKIGHGKGGFMMWTSLDAPMKVCCCLPCGGGFPCCPPPCCWCCCHPQTCGTCCGGNYGEGAAIFMQDFLLPKFPGFHGFKGTLVAPVQKAM